MVLEGFRSGLAASVLVEVFSDATCSRIPAGVTSKSTCSLPVILTYQRLWSILHVFHEVRPRLPLADKHC